MTRTESAWLPVHPWPLPSALGLACGIAARAGELSAWLLLLLLPFLWVARAALLRRVDEVPTRGIGTRSPRLPAYPARPAQTVVYPPRAVVALALPLIMVATGYARYDHWLSRPDPLACMRDREVRLAGTSDGRVVTLEPGGARVAVSPAGALPAGRVEFVGTLRQAAGRRNPGGFDYRGYLLRRGIHGQVTVREVLDSEERQLPRDRLRAGVTAGLPAGPSALMEAMTLGIRDELGGLRDVFARAGLAHVLALSGLHVGLLMATAGRLLGALGTLRYPLLLALDFGYMLLVGATPSVVRAAVMVAVVLFSLWWGAGRIQAWPALGLAALATLLPMPAWLFDISFQLSYGAVAGILLFALPFAGRLRGSPPLPWWHPRLSVAGALLTSVAAQALTLPLVASSFGTLPLLSPVVNLLGLPLAAVLVPLGFTAALVGLVSLPLAALINGLTAIPAAALIVVAEQGAHLPALVWGEIEPVGYAFFASAGAALALAAAGRLRLWRALLVVAIASALSAATPPRHSLPEFVALDVGQGDSLLLRLKGRVEVLVDGGGSPFSSYDVGAGDVLPALRALGVDELELVVATHADADHIEGLASVLRGMPVQLLVYGVAEPQRPVFADLMAVASERGVPVRSLSRGERLTLAGVTLEVLNPPPRGYGRGNDDSLALAVYHRGSPRALLVGDISAAVERDLVPPEVDILVAPHHGSPSSTSEHLLNAARPRNVVISVGSNRYGHPSPAVLERLQAVGAEVHVTREAGAIRLPLGP